MPRKKQTHAAKRAIRAPKSLAPPLPPGRVVLRIGEVCARYDWRRHQLRNAILAGHFPAPVRLTPVGHPRWYLEDLEAFDRARRVERASA
jgi:predicted DNA-binding transcriptional regulator AlpA